MNDLVENIVAPSSSRGFDSLKVSDYVELLHGPCDEKFKDPRNKTGSVCHNINIINDFDPIVSRAPFVTADFIVSIISKNSTFVEVGARYGVITQCVSHYSNLLAAIEYDVKSCEGLKRAGFKAICGDFFELNETNMPVADLFYWFMLAKYNIKFFKHLDTVLKKLKVKSKVAMGFDLQEEVHGYHQEREVGTWLTMRYQSSVHRLCFNEGNRKRESGIRIVAVFDVGLGVVERKISTNAIEDELCVEYINKQTLNPNLIYLGDLAPVALYFEKIFTPSDTFITVLRSSNLTSFIFPLYGNPHDNKRSIHWFPDKNIPKVAYYFIVLVEANMVQLQYERLDIALKHVNHRAHVFLLLDLEDFESREMAIWLSLRYRSRVKKICKQNKSQSINSAYAIITLSVGLNSDALALRFK